MKRAQLVLIGPHAAGKTTLGRILARRLGWRFDDEIGACLRKEALARDPGAHAMVAQAEFDRRVILEELARDALAAGPRIIETWHPGNLAYAFERSPKVARAFLSEVRSAVRAMSTRTVVQPLWIPRETALARLSEPGPDPEALTAFFDRVSARAEKIARELGLEVFKPLDCSRQAPEALAQIIHGRVGGLSSSES